VIESCGTCKFYRRLPSPRCCVEPPRTFVVPIPQQSLTGQVEMAITVHGAFPPVKESEWCARWAASDEPEPGN
jgi:hypothetical protein